MPFQSLDICRARLTAVWEPLQSESSEKTRDLRECEQKGVRELYQGFLFASVYADAFELKDMELECNPEQYSDFDVTLRWDTGGIKTYMKVQLTELPPDRLNRGRITLQQLFNKKTVNQPKAPDVTLVLFINSSGANETVDSGDFGMRDFWFFGYSQPDLKEMFLIGQDSLGKAHRIFRKLVTLSSG